MRRIKNFIKLKEGLSPYDILEKYKDDPTVMFSFRDEHYTLSNKIAINLVSSYKSTPNGIYCYPLNIMWKNFDHKYKRIMGIPFTGEQKPKAIVIMKLKDKGLNLSNYSINNFKEDVEKLNKKYTHIFSEDIDEARESIQDYEYYQGIKQEHEYSYIIWNLIRNLFLKEKKGKPKNTNFWNFLLSKVLDYKWAIDEGLGIIHINEPIQCVIFENSGYDLIDSIDISKIDYASSQKELTTDISIYTLLKNLLLIRDYTSILKFKNILKSNPKFILDIFSFMVDILPIKEVKDILIFIVNNKVFDTYKKDISDIINVDNLIHNLIRYDDYEVIKILFDNFYIDINKKDSNIFNFSILQLACRHRDVNIIKLILKQSNVDINFRNDLDQTALSIAKELSNNEEIINLLIEYGATE